MTLLRALGLALALSIVGYLGLCTWLYVRQRSLLYFPQPRTVTAAASTMQLSVDGALLVVTVRPRASPKAIVYFGGNAEDVSQNLANFEAWFPDHALYLLHYRGFGGSTGSPTEAALHADAAALFEAVRAAHAEVVVIGRSLGSGVAVRLGSERPVGRLVLVTPYDSIEAVAAAQYPFAPVSWLLRDKFLSWQYAPRVTARTHVIAAERDVVIPLDHSARLLASFAPGVASMTVIPGADHNDLDLHDAYRRALQAAL